MRKSRKMMHLKFRLRQCKITFLRKNSKRKFKVKKSVSKLIKVAVSRQYRYKRQTLLLKNQPQREYLCLTFTANMSRK